MWILYILPSWYTHAVPILGIVIILISMFLKVIPVISTYYLPLRIIGLIIFIFGIFFEGVMFSGKELESKVKEFFVNSKIDPSKLFGNFGVQSGTNMEAFIKSLKQDRDNFDVKSYTNSLSMISLLNTNVIDFVIMDSIPAKAFASRNKNLQYIKLHETKFDLGIVFPKNSKLIDKVNEVIDDMIDDGEIEKIERKILREFDE